MLNRFEKFICSITEIDLYWHRTASSVMKAYGLKGSYAIYFTLLHGHPEGMTAAELSASSGKDKADVSRDIAVLECAGYVNRDRSGGNGYRAKITLTESGLVLTEKVISQATRAVDFVGTGLSEEERGAFYHALEIITANLQNLSRNGFPQNSTEQENDHEIHS